MWFTKSWISAWSKCRDLERETKHCSQAAANIFILEIKYTFSSRSIGTNGLICVQFARFCRNGKSTDIAGRYVEQHWVWCFFFLESDHVPPLVPAVCSHLAVPDSSTVTFLERSWTIRDLWKTWVWYQAGSTDEPNGNEKPLKSLHTSRVNLDYQT